jgi:GST-like protein
MDEITLHMWATPNSRRISILFEELCLDFAVNPVNIRAKEQFAPEILALNPFGKVPIVTWRENDEPRALFESGAILMHFADSCNQLLDSAGPARDETVSWLMIVLTALGPASGQTHHWHKLDPNGSATALEFNKALTERVYRLLDARLSEHHFIAGNYSIADIAAYPWILVSEWTGLDMNDYPHLSRWFVEIGQRPAVTRGIAFPVSR